MADTGWLSSHGSLQTPSLFSERIRTEYRSFSDKPVNSADRQLPSTRTPVVQSVVLPLRQCSTMQPVMGEPPSESGTFHAKLMRPASVLVTRRSTGGNGTSEHRHTKRLHHPLNRNIYILRTRTVLHTFPKITRLAIIQYYKLMTFVLYYIHQYFGRPMQSEGPKLCCCAFCKTPNSSSARSVHTSNVYQRFDSRHHYSKVQKHLPTHLIFTVGVKMRHIIILFSTFDQSELQFEPPSFRNGVQYVNSFLNRYASMTGLW